jgi:hypothetical protein
VPARTSTGWADFKVTDPSPVQRLLHAAAIVPGLLLVAEAARLIKRGVAMRSELDTVI